MSNFILGYGDVGLNCFYESIDSWTTSLPLTMLNNKYIKAIAKSDADTGVVIDITVDAADVSDIEVMGIVNTNMITGTYRWLCFSDAARLTNVYDSGTLTTPTFNDKINYKTLVTAADTSYANRYWRLQISETTGSFVSIGRIFLGKRFDVDQNMDYGMTMGVDDKLTKVIVSNKGTEVFNKAPRKRITNFSLSLIAYNLADEYFKMELEDGLSGSVLFEFNPEAFKGGLYTYIGRLSGLSPLQYTVYNRNQINCNITEII